MNEQLQLLIDLRELDSQIKGKERLISESTEKVNRLEEDIRLKEGELKEGKDELALKEKDLRSKERKLEDVNNHFQKCKDRIYMIKSNKELVALDEEIERIKKEKSLLEDENLMLMEAIEELTPRIKMKEKNLEEEKSKISSEKKNYEDILTETQENLNLFLKERNDIAGKIDKVLLAEYQKFYRSKGDFGIAAIHDRVCQGCHMKISAQLEKGIRKNEQIIRCENCARILYYQEK